ncbi:unnamed protein product [Brassicogethes aeneus]|uniref:Major facilitator superfamily (MFS) profile domain-containing protein n=1 Tax=Brassicogethes aeneus TaxID=1431903 RepID=A0A9P0ARG9_BRAAE|nr:unnamed protein product [Brassicogethes aeneus]
MVNHTGIIQDKNMNCSACVSPKYACEEDDGPFKWSTLIQGIILSANLVGFLAIQYPGERWIQRRSPKWVFSFAVLTNIFCVYMTPLVAKNSLVGLILLRILSGIGGGVVFPIAHVLILNWAPSDELFVLMNIVQSGTLVGGVLFTWLSGGIIYYLTWEYVFYIEGTLAVIWLILWLIFAADSPVKARFISELEREYLSLTVPTIRSRQLTMREVHEYRKTPWKIVLSSPPYLAILFAQIFSEWSWTLLQLDLPTYINYHLGFHIVNNAFLTSIPFISIVAVRVLIAILTSFGVSIIYGLKVNFHLVLINMVNHTGIIQDKNMNCSACVSPKYACEEDDGPFKWSTLIQGIILSANLVGFLAIQYPGERWIQRRSPKWVFSFAVLTNIFCVYMTPLVAKNSLVGLILLRILSGIGGGVVFPIAHVLILNWAPSDELFVLMNIVQSGTLVGGVLFTWLSGGIIYYLTWEYVFYIEGTLAVIWLILWLIFAADSPVKARFISELEREYLSLTVPTIRSRQLTMREVHEYRKTPWKIVLSSPPYLAILFAQIFSEWSWTLLQLDLPTYINYHLGFHIVNNAFLTSIPFICMFIFGIIFNNAIQKCISKQKIKVVTARKVATSIASLIPMCCFLALGFIDCKKWYINMALISIAMAAMAAMYSGFISNHFDIAPLFGGTLLNVSKSVAAFCALEVPILVGYLITDDYSIKSWRIVFWVASVLHFLQFLVFVAFASGDIQAWNNLGQEDEM